MSTDADTFIDGCGVTADIPLGRGVRIRFGQGATSLSVWASGETPPSGDGASGDRPLGETGASGDGASGETGVYLAGHYGALTVGVLAANAVHVHAQPPAID